MTSPTKRRRLSRDEYQAGLDSWKAGEPWSVEWRRWRHLAATEAGIVLAPEGSQWDQWDADHPSQRAMLVRAIRETPAALEAAIRSPGVRSWGDVLAILLGQRDRQAERVRDDERSAVGADPSPREAARVLGRIGSVIDDGERQRLREAYAAGRCPTCGQSVPVPA